MTKETELYISLCFLGDHPFLIVFKSVCLKLFVNL